MANRPDTSKRFTHEAIREEAKSLKGTESLSDQYAGEMLLQLLEEIDELNQTVANIQESSGGFMG